MNDGTSPALSRVVIIGGGFAGLNLVKHLAKDKYMAITLVDQNNYNYFTPLVYQVATGFLEPTSISYPFRKLFRKHRNVVYRWGKLESIDPDNHTCHLNNGMLTYDYLVLASGTRVNYYGNKEIKAHAIPMKTVDDALRMRNVLLERLEQASISRDPGEMRRLLSFAIAGGGPTGVEVCGMLAELRKNIISRDYPELRGAPNGIYLIDKGQGVLGAMSPKSGKDALRTLQELGVTLKLGNTVTNYDGRTVSLSGGEQLEAGSLIWAAGVKAQPVLGIPVEGLGRSNRFIVDQYCRVKGVRDIFSIGDVCIMEGDTHFPQGHPQLAQVAIQMGKHLALNLKALRKAGTLKEFRYLDEGTLAIIGRNRAVADLIGSRYHVGGIPALYIWLFVHLRSLVTFQNKWKTLFSWIIAYLTRDQSLRVIIRPNEELLEV